MGVGLGTKGWKKAEKERKKEQNRGEKTEK